MFKSSVPRGRIFQTLVDNRFDLFLPGFLGFCVSEQAFGQMGEEWQKQRISTRKQGLPGVRKRSTARRKPRRSVAQGIETFMGYLHRASFLFSGCSFAQQGQGCPRRAGLRRHQCSRLSLPRWFRCAHGLFFWYCCCFLFVCPREKPGRLHAPPHAPASYLYLDFPILMRGYLYQIS